MSRLKPSGWVAFIIVGAGLLFSFILGGMIWRGETLLKIVAWFAFALIGGGYLAYRAWVRRAPWPQTGNGLWGLEWVLALGLLVFGLLLARNPYWRDGLWRYGYFLLYLVIFYLLLDYFSNTQRIEGGVAALIFASGVLLSLSVMELFAWYERYWAGVGQRWVAPPYPYRIVSLLGHPNPLLLVANLVAPLVVLQFFTTKKILPRVLAWIWLIFYVLVMPFSSSRGGWVGMLAWMGILGLYATWQAGWWARLKQLDRRAKLLAGGLVAGIFVLVAGGTLAYFFFTSSHPTHGGLLSGRELIWGTAVKIWLSSPWLGVGLGRFPYAYLQMEPSVFPTFWATHAHNLGLHALAETGVVGALAVLLMGLGFALWLLGGIRNSTGAARPLFAAALAALAAFTVQSVFDEYTYWPAVMVPAMVILALAGGARLVEKKESQEESLPAPQRFSAVIGVFNKIAWLWIPFLGLLGISGWALWAAQPAAQAVEQAQTGQWTDAARLFEQSAGRDPNLAYYSTEAGLAWAQAWSQTHDPKALDAARNAFQQSLKQQPEYSFVWANLAMLDWYAGDARMAEARMEHAVILSPNEASLTLLLGWLKEQGGQNGQALHYYLRALQLHPDWVSHPFWQQTAPRRIVYEAAQKNLKPEAAVFWRQAQQDLAAGDQDAARRALTLSELLGESDLAQMILRIRLEGQTAGSEKQLAQRYKDFNQRIENQNFNDPGFWRNYSVWVNHRNGLPITLVPGFLQLDADVGQFVLLEDRWKELVGNSRCDEAAQVWNLWQRSLQGGVFGQYPPAPACGGPRG